MAGDIHGYSGPINLWVRFDTRGTLEQVTLRGHSETPSYVSGIPHWLGILEGHRYHRPFAGKGGVDVLSGATVTCDAILRILGRARARAGSDLLGLAPGRPLPPRPSFWARLFSGPRAWGCLGFLVLMALGYRWGGWRSRLGLLVVSVGVMGFWLNVPFTAVDLAGLGWGTLPGGGEKAVLVLGVLLLSVAFGQIWCGMGCPFGALQELLWLMVHPKGRHGAARLGTAAQVSPDLEMRARYLKFAVLVLVLSFYAISGDPAYLAVDPMTSVFTRRMPVHVIWLLLAIGLGSLIYFRPFCRYLCPAGAFLALFNKLRLLDRLAGLDRARVLSRCDLGVTTQSHLDCLKCNRCLDRGPNGSSPVDTP